MILKTIPSIKLIPAVIEANIVEVALEMQNIFPQIHPIYKGAIDNIPSKPLFKNIGIKIG